MFRRHLKVPHDFVCVTDNAAGLDLDYVRPVELWPDHYDTPNPHGPREPACYRRLKLFSAEAASLVGERILSVDLDMVLMGDISHIVDRPEQFVFLPTDAPNIPINGSLQLITPGAAEEVWTSFDADTSPRLARAAGCFGSDQGWIGYHVAQGALKEKVGLWDAGPGGKDRILFFGAHVRRFLDPVQADARVISFHGAGKPWGEAEQLIGWVKRHYGEPDGQTVPSNWKGGK